MSDKKAHGSRRRMTARRFADGIVRQFEPKMLHYIQVFCDRLYSSVALHDPCNQVPWGPAMDMSHWFNYLTFDTMTEYIFGKRSNMLAKRKNQKLMFIFERLLDFGGILFYLPLPYPEKLNAVLLKLVNQRHDAFSAYITENPEARRGLPPDQLPGDVFSHLVTSRDMHSGKMLNHEELQSECLILSIAGMIKPVFPTHTNKTHTRLGYDTLSTALAATIFYLSRYQHACTRLSNELQTVFGSIEEIRPGEKLKACHYLNASITEALRITPPVTMCLSREVEETGEFIDGQFLPPGCLVGTSIYAMHRNAEYFPHPEFYLPERWLTTSGHFSGPNENKGSPAAVAYNPFSIGPRACLGKTLALVELSTIIARLVWTYEFKPAEGPGGRVGEGNTQARGGRKDPNEFQLYDRITTRMEGPIIQFRPRRCADNMV